jgi:hypothetical protein
MTQTGFTLKASKKTRKESDDEKANVGLDHHLATDVDTGLARIGLETHGGERQPCICS